MEIEITEKRRKLTLSETLNSIDDADGVIVRMELRDKEGERKLEDATDEAAEIAVGMIDKAKNEVELLLKENDSDILFLLDYYNRNPPGGKSKKHKTIHGVFGAQTENEKRKIKASEETHNAALELAIEINKRADKLKDTKRTEHLLKQAELIHSIFKKDTRTVRTEVTDYSIDKKLLKDLDPELIVELGGEYIPQKETFIVQYGSGIKYEFIKAVKKLAETLGSFLNKNKA